MVHNYAPSYLHKSLHETHPPQYKLQHSDYIPVIRGCTVIDENSFFPKTIWDWKGQPENTKDTTTLKTFSLCRTEECLFTLVVHAKILHSTLTTVPADDICLSLIQ